MWKPTISSDEIYHTAIAHSAKGSTWKDHKYIKKVNGRYIYSSDKAKGVEQIRGEAMNKKIAKENEAADKIKQAHEVIKKAQKKASEHPIHVTRVKEDWWGNRRVAAQNNRQEYRFRSNKPGSSETKYDFDTRGDRATHMKSRIEKADFFAASASKDANKNRKIAAKENKEHAAYSYKDMPYDADDPEGAEKRKRKAKKEYKKWSTIEKSASIREKQQAKYDHTHKASESKQALYAKKNKKKTASNNATKRKHSANSGGKF